MTSSCVLALLIGTPQLPARSQTFSPVVQSTSQPSEDPAIATTIAQIKRLDDAVLTITIASDDESHDIRRKLKTLSSLASAYSEIGEQARAIETLLLAEKIASDNVETLYYYPRTIAEIASFYGKINEVEAAQRLLEQAIELSQSSTGKRSRASAIGDIAEAYSLIEDPTVTKAGLASLVNLIEDADGPLWEDRKPFVPQALIAAYGQLDDEAEANRALSRLFEASTTSSLETLILYSKAYSQQNNPEAAQNLLAQAINPIRSSDKGISLLLDIGIVAAGYGALDNVAVAEQGLAELTELSNSTPLLENVELSEEQELIASFSRMQYDLTSLGAIAIAYSKLDNFSKAQAVLAPLTERFLLLAEAGILSSGLPYLWPLVATYEEIGDMPAQEATLQMMFDAVPGLQELSSQGLNIADVTPGYLGVTAILKGYVATKDDAIAQERLQILEGFFKEIRFAEGGYSDQLAGLAAAAIRRGDEANALRLMSDAMQLIGTPEDQLIPDDPRFNNLGGTNFEQAQLAKVLRYMAQNYSNIKDEQARQAGLEATKQLASRLLESKLRSEVDDAIVRAYVGL